MHSLLVRVSIGFSSASLQICDFSLKGRQDTWSKCMRRLTQVNSNSSKREKEREGRRGREREPRKYSPNTRWQIGPLIEFSIFTSNSRDDEGETETFERTARNLGYKVHATETSEQVKKRILCARCLLRSFYISPAIAKSPKRFTNHDRLFLHRGRIINRDWSVSCDCYCRNPSREKNPQFW